MTTADQLAPTVEPMLVLDEVNTFYGQIHALQGVNLAVAEGEIVG